MLARWWSLPRDEHLHAPPAGHADVRLVGDGVAVGALPGFYRAILRTSHPHPPNLLGGGLAQFAGEPAGNAQAGIPGFDELGELGFQPLEFFGADLLAPVGTDVVEERLSYGQQLLAALGDAQTLAARVVRVALAPYVVVGLE